MTDVFIHSPFSRQSSQGNSVTANRLEKILQQQGFSVAMEAESYRGESANCLIALNARRSAEAVDRFQNACPDGSIVVILTGTDINHPEAEDIGSATWRCLEKADSLVLLHDASLVAVPEPFRDKCTVVFPSVTLPDGLKHTPVGKDFTIVMAGNMREEKNPALASKASMEIPDFLSIHTYGESTSPSTARFIGHGVVPHDEMLIAMSKSHILLNTSFQEGGANAICEAISMGLPVIASAIPGNIGMLSEDYAGLFPSDDLTALVKILEKSATDSAFYNLLKQQVAARAPLFAYAAEVKAWSDLIKIQLSL